MQVSAYEEDGARPGRARDPGLLASTVRADGPRRHRTAKAIREAGFYEPSDSARFWASSQMCPAGSAKLAVRMPHGRSTGPLSSPTP